MNTVVETRPQTEQPKLRWTRDEANRLAELFPDQRYELIEGELINKMGQKPPHAFVIEALTSLLTTPFHRRVRLQLPIELSGADALYSEPEPDVAITHGVGPAFHDKHPSPADIALLIEVAYSSLDRDTGTKARLYARNGIQRYWIVDIVGRRVILQEQPSGEGYLSVQVRGESDVIEFGGWKAAVSEILPPAR